MTQVLRRAFDILEQVARDPEVPTSLGELARRVELPAPTCARLLQSLVECGYVEQLGPKKGYILGPMAYALAARGPYRKDLVRAAGPVMAQLAAETGETVLLAILRGGKRIVLHQVDGTQSVQVRSDRLQIDDPLRTATGRLLLAHLPAGELHPLLLRHGRPAEAWPEAGSEEGVRRALEELRGLGVVTRADDGEVVGVASAIYEGGRVIATVGLYLPAHRFTGAHRERVLAGIQAGATAISRAAEPDSRPFHGGKL